MLCRGGTAKRRLRQWGQVLRELTQSTVLHAYCMTYPVKNKISFVESLGASRAISVANMTFSQLLQTNVGSWTQPLVKCGIAVTLRQEAQVTNTSSILHVTAVSSQLD